MPTRLVNRVITRDAAKMAVGQVYYTPWCDDEGKVIDDGTVTRVAEQSYRWTAAASQPALAHRQRLGTEGRDRGHLGNGGGAGAARTHVGPAACARWRRADLDSLKYFRATSGSIAGVPVDISRTGYTGDLGYEIWMPWNAALQVWDAIAVAGRAFDLHPTGMLALDIARIEAGLLLIDVDFQSSRKALIESQKYSPFELGLGRLVDLKKGAFAGRAALAEERLRGHARQIVGLEIDWMDVEKLYERVGLPPTAPGRHVTRRRAGLQGRHAGRPRHIDDVVDDAEEADRAGDDRRAALCDRHAAGNRNDGRGRPSSRRRDRRPHAVLQPARKTAT